MKIVAKAKIQALVATPQANMTQIQLQVMDEIGNQITQIMVPMNSAEADAAWAERATDFTLTIEKK